MLKLNLMFNKKSQLITLVSSLTIASAIVIASPIIAWKVQPQSTTDQSIINYEDPSGYQDAHSNFKISAYAKLLQAIGFDADMDFRTITNSYLTRSLKQLNLDQKYQIKVASGSNQSNLVELSLSDLHTRATTSIQIENFNWNARVNTVNEINVDPASFQWDIQRWIQQKLPLALADYQPNYQPLLDLNSQAIKSLVKNFKYQTSTIWYEGQNPEALNRNYQYDQKWFEFKFVPVANSQQVALKIILKPQKADFVVKHFAYQSAQDQWIQVKTEQQNLQMETTVNEWRGSDLTINPIDQPDRTIYNQPLSLIFSGKVKAKPLKQKLLYSPSELTYFSQNDFKKFWQIAPLQNVLEVNQDLFQQFFPKVKANFSFVFVDGRDNNLPPYPLQDAYLKVDDEIVDFDDLNYLKIIPQVEINGHYYRFDNSDRSLWIRKDQLLTLNDLAAFKNPVAFIKAQAPWKQTLIEQMHPDLINNIKTWFSDPVANANLESQIRQLAKQVDPNQVETSFIIKSNPNYPDYQPDADLDHIQANFEFPNQQLAIKQLTTTKPYFQPAQTLNLTANVFSTTYQNQIHYFHLANANDNRPWKWNLKSLDYNDRQFRWNWNFDRNAGLIKISFQADFSWASPKPYPNNQDPNATVVLTLTPQDFN